MMTSFTKDLLIGILLACLTLVFAIIAQAASEVSTEVRLPGTQPNEVSNFESPHKFDNCHAGYNDAGTVAAGVTWNGTATAVGFNLIP
jgi:hypothetical protein